MACSFCLSLFLTPFNCFSVDPPLAKILSGIVPVQHGFLHGLQSLQRCTSSCVCMFSTHLLLSFPSCLLHYLPLYLHLCIILCLLHHLCASSLPSSCISTCASCHVFLCVSSSALVSPVPSSYWPFLNMFPQRFHMLFCLVPISVVQWVWFVLHRAGWKQLCPAQGSPWPPPTQVSPAAPLLQNPCHLCHIQF